MYSIYDPNYAYGGDSYYGGYRTRTFGEIFPSYDAFRAEIWDTDIPIPDDIKDDEQMSLIYAMLYSRYGNSHIINSDENQFLYRLAATIYQYGPTYIKRLSIQEEIRKLTTEQLREGSRAIYNHSLNPDTPPSTSTLEELPTIDSQNTTNYKKSAAEGYAIISSLLETDMTDDFLREFRKLFIKVLAPDRPLLYDIP